MKKVPEEAFKSGVLDKILHERLLADLKRVATIAGIPSQFIWARMSDYCSSEVISWVAGMRRSQDAGLAITGAQNIPIDSAMMAMAGAFLRNYIDARVMPVQDVVAHLKDGSMPTPSVLLIPNFCLSKDDGGNIPSWEVSSLLGLLLSRRGQNVKTILYFDNLKLVEQNYGAAFKTHIENHYTVIES